MFLFYFFLVPQYVKLTQILEELKYILQDALKLKQLL